MGIQVTDLHVLRDQCVRRRSWKPRVAKSQTANMLQLLEQVDRAWNGWTLARTGYAKSAMKRVESERLCCMILWSVWPGLPQPAETTRPGRRLTPLPHLSKPDCSPTDLSAAAGAYSYPLRSRGASQRRLL